MFWKQVPWVLSVRRVSSHLCGLFTNVCAGVLMLFFYLSGSHSLRFILDARTFCSMSDPSVREGTAGLILLTVVSADASAPRLISSCVSRFPRVSSHLIGRNPWEPLGAWAFASAGAPGSYSERFSKAPYEAHSAHLHLSFEEEEMENKVSFCDLSNIPRIVHGSAHLPSTAGTSADLRAAEGKRILLLASCLSPF